jgi:glycosyltransferase involved in cell wall biosynthesis
MTDHSSSDAPSHSADNTPQKVDSILTELVGRSVNDLTRDQRTELLHGLLGQNLCRRLGIQRLPEGFVLSVIIPVYNEVKTLESVIQRVRGTGLPLEIVLIDDGSTDGTRDLLAQMEHDSDCRVIFHERNQGKGAALKTGLAAATGTVMVIQDADMEYDPLDYHALLQPILEDRADVVYGSRFSSTVRQVPPLWHQAANQLITSLTVLASGYRFTDVETCYKMFRRSAIQEIIPTLREKRFGIEIELTFKLLRQENIRIFERPIRYERRSYAEGKKIGWRDGVAALWCIFRYSLFH